MRVEISHVRPGDDAADGGPDANKRVEDVPESEARWIEDLTQGDIRVSPSNHAAGLQFNTVTLLALRVSSDTVRLLNPSPPQRAWSAAAGCFWSSLGRLRSIDRLGSLQLSQSP